MIKPMAEAHIELLIVLSSSQLAKESGRTTNSMVTVNSPGVMAESILVATNSTREMVKESSLGPMDANITVVG